MMAFAFPAMAQGEPLGADSGWLQAIVSFILGVLVAALIYVLFRDKVEKVYEKFGRSRFGSFLPTFYHRDSITDRVYGYYLWDAQDGFELLSPLLRQILRIDDTYQTFEGFQRALVEEDYAKLLHEIQRLKAGEAEEFRAVLRLSRAQAVLECIGILRSPPMRPGITVWFRDITTSVREVEQAKSDAEMLRQRNRQLQRISDYAPFPVWQRDADLAITYCNSSYADMVEESSHSVLDAHTLELDAQVQLLAREAQRTGKVQERVLYIVSHGARTRFRVIENPIFNGSQIEGYVGFALDMAGQEAVEAELKRYISAQGEFLESSASAMAIYGADTRLKSYNQAFLRLWKLDEPWLDMEPGYADVLESLREKRRLPEQANFPMFKKQNLEFFTTLIKSHEEYYYLPDGRVLRVIVIPHALGGLLFAYEDVTDRLALERNYNTLIAVQRATLDRLREGVAVFGEDGRLRLYNPEFAGLFQIDRKTLDAEPHLGDLVEMARALLHTGEVWEEFQERIVVRMMERQGNGGRLHLSDGKVLDWLSVPLPDGAMMITFYDITSAIIVEETLRDKNKALEESDRVKTEFLASMSYELRSPLTSIMGFSEALKKNYFGELNVKQQEYMEAINSSSHKLMSLINNILDMATIEAGYMKLTLTNFPVKALLDEIYQLQAERIKESRLELLLEYDDTLGSMRGDELRIKQIIFNLLHNAIKFSEEGGKIIIGARQVEDEQGHQMIAVWVEDHGEGMSKEEQTLAFERFYRGASVKARKTGAGLGLSMVKRFAELHGGKVHLSSIAGKGTKVTCYFPRDAEVIEAAMAAYAVK